MDQDSERERNRACFLHMLDALGRKDWDAGFACMTADVRCDWPYPPIPQMDAEMSGRATIRAFFDAGQAPFAGLNYRVEQIYEQLDPAMLIAEYSSDSRHLASGTPYRNRYLGILRFRAGLVCYWREYINPMIVKEVLDASGAAR